MSTHKHIDRICAATVILSLLIAVIFMNGTTLGVQAATRKIGYEDRIFDPSRVHTIDIVMEDWEGFLETCENEEYEVASVLIDGEAYKNVGIRAKGNTSLSSVSAMNSDRYSFKIEFDQYDKTKSYHGLDKLSLNNVIQDNTYMKDYLTYRLMDSFGVDAPLCSFAFITVNGEDWGVYLAVEAVEDGFLQRNYGNDYGELYKPDGMGFGGGRGNGRNFNMEDFLNRGGENEGENSETSETSENSDRPSPGGFGGQFPGGFGGQMPEGFDGQFPGGFGGQMPEGFGGQFPGGFGGQMPEGFDGQFPGGFGGQDQQQNPGGGGAGRGMGGFGGGMGGFGGGMGSSDVRLQYSDDDPESYSSIFENAKTDISAADKSRLIQSLKKLTNQEEIEKVVDIDEVLRYFVVHNYVVNGDSYTGSMVHNYYLYEEDGQLSMIPWDYNLAFGSFSFMGAGASGSVNDPIDSPLSVTGNGDRPMIDWIFSSEEYTELYHQYFSEFIEGTDAVSFINEAYDLIAPYVEKDPTAFCSYEAFEEAVEELRTFCTLRTESVKGQLSGKIPTTDEGQAADPSSLIDASELDISKLGSMGGGFGGFGGRNGGFGGNQAGSEGQIGGFGGNGFGFGGPNGGFGGMGGFGGSERPDGNKRPEAGDDSEIIQIPDNHERKMPGTEEAQESEKDTENSDDEEAESLDGKNNSKENPDPGEVNEPEEEPKTKDAKNPDDAQTPKGSQNTDNAEERQNFADRFPQVPEESSRKDPGTVILFAASVLVMLVGLVVALMYKR